MDADTQQSEILTLLVPLYMPFFLLLASGWSGVVVVTTRGSIDLSLNGLKIALMVVELLHVEDGM
jgi:hypothetical protein